MNLFAKKDLGAVVREATDPNLAEGHGLHRSLGAFHLTMLGIGAIIGAGIFSLTGRAAADYAGPGIAYSFIIGGILCAFAGLCYAELAAMIPVAGSAYAYSYTTMGELIAWIIGWDLVLEYAFGAVTVSAAWSGYFYSIMTKTLGIPFSETAARLTKGPWETVTYHTANGTEVTVPGLFNLPATFIAIVCAAVLYRGIKESAWVNNIIVIVKISIVCIFVAMGIGLVMDHNLFVNAAATGLAKLVPARELVDGKWHYGWGLNGVMTGAGVVFFAYIGFDAVSTTAQEAKDPQRTMPIGILASLAICTILYILVAITLTGVVNYKELGVPDPIAVGIDKIVELRGWTPASRKTFTFLIKLGAIAGLSSVILVMMLGQTRVFYAMAKDKLLPRFGETHPRFKTPHVATVVTGAFVAVCGGLMPMHLVGELVSIGTLLAFVLVCIGVPILRRTNPGQHRPFKVPAPDVVGVLGALACIGVMAMLPSDTWFRLTIWLLIGFAVYVGYGMKHSAVTAGTVASHAGAMPYTLTFVGGALLLTVLGFHHSFEWHKSHTKALVSFGVAMALGIVVLIVRARQLSSAKA